VVAVSIFIPQTLCQRWNTDVRNCRTEYSRETWSSNVGLLLRIGCPERTASTHVPRGFQNLHQSMDKKLLLSAVRGHGYLLCIPHSPPMCWMMMEMDIGAAVSLRRRRTRCIGLYNNYLFLKACSFFQEYLSNLIVAWTMPPAAHCRRVHLSHCRRRR
jgi:hypothetical protein